MTHNPVPLISRLSGRVALVRKVLLTEYCKSHSTPWVVAYSGGKDSTLLLQSVWEMLLSLNPEKYHRPITVIGNDTLVESPLIIEHLKDSIKVISTTAKERNLPISTQITKPCVDQTFWVCVIGRGYMPPTRNFRWCTDRMKIMPTDSVLKRIIAKKGHAILLIGTRRSESQNRQRTMKKHGVQADKMNPHRSIEGCSMFAPLADLVDNDVWTILLQTKPPWGGRHRNLVTLYRNAGGGECPLILTKEDAPSCGTTSPRFGCWTCTVVKKDRSMRGTIASRHPEEEKLELLADFRDELITLRENNENRWEVRRDGYPKRRPDGTLVYGPFKLEVRKRILERLLELQLRIGKDLISRTEIDFIKDIWRHDETQEKGRVEMRKALGMV